MADAPPPKRLYFDSNILRGWPYGPIVHCSNEIWNIFGVANRLKTELYIPKTVADELEGQFLRNVNDVFDSLEASAKKLNKICHNIISNDLTGTVSVFSRPS